MEKLPIIFSLLLRNYLFMAIFWTIISAGNAMMFAPLRLWSSKALNQKRLTEISPKYAEINYEVIVYSIAWLAVSFIMAWLFWIRLDNWALANYEMRFYPSFVFIWSGYGIYQALFALRKGVYPMGRYLYFIYDDENSIRRVAKYHIVSSIGIFFSSLLCFFLTPG